VASAEAAVDPNTVIGATSDKLNKADNALEATPPAPRPAEAEAPKECLLTEKPSLKERNMNDSTFV
jgi:hypothetical protein